MSAASKFFKLSEHMMLEYIPADLADIDTNANDNSADAPDEYYIYEGNDANIYYTTPIKGTAEDANYYSQLGVLQKYPDESDSEYVFPGIGSDFDFAEHLAKNVYNYERKTINIADKAKYYSDKIRVYFIYGFTLDTLQGITIQAKSKATYGRYDYKVSEHTGQYLKENGEYVFDDTKVIRDETDVIYLDYFLPKELLKDCTHFMVEPLYLNTRFYDRYIEISFPSYYAIAKNNYEEDNVVKNDLIDFTFTPSFAGRRTDFTILLNSPLNISFSTVSDTEATTEILTYHDNAGNALDIKYGRKFILNYILDLAIKPHSNTDYFNVRIYKNPDDERTILYYPVYGEGPTARDLDINIMNSIEDGTIMMVDQGYGDHVLDNDEFLEIYGDTARKWIIYNEMNIVYNYTLYIQGYGDNVPINYSYRDTFTNILDYSNKSDLDGAFWRLILTPNIKKFNNLYCSSIHIQYSCRLINRCNGAEAIRTSSLTLLYEDIQKMTATNLTLNGQIVTYKVVNKIVNNNTYTQTAPVLQKEKYIRSYYDATDIIAKDMESGFAYALGQMPLRLKHSSTNYCLRLYTLNSDNVRIPYDLSGQYTYKLIFPGLDGKNTEILPNMDSKLTNLGIGQIVYYITSDLVKRIMSIPDQYRYFAIVVDTDGTDAQQTTLYEGKVQYY